MGPGPSSTRINRRTFSLSATIPSWSRSADALVLVRLELVADSPKHLRGRGLRPTIVENHFYAMEALGVRYSPILGKITSPDSPYCQGKLTFRSKTRTSSRLMFAPLWRS